MTKLRRLEVNAICNVLNGNDPDGDVDRMYIPQEFTYMFSRVLIEECIKQIKDIPTDGIHVDVYREEVCNKLYNLFK